MDLQGIRRKGLIIGISMSCICTLAFVSYMQIIPISVILLLSDDDCSEPIRDWLIVYDILLGVYCIIACARAYVNYKYYESQWGSKIVQGFVLGASCFGLVWFIAGCIFVFGDLECDWTDGYNMSLAIIIINFITIGLGFCGLIVLLCVILIKGKDAVKFLKKSEGNEEVNNIIKQLEQVQQEFNQSPYNAKQDNEINAHNVQVEFGAKRKQSLSLSSEDVRRIQQNDFKEDQQRNRKQSQSSSSSEQAQQDYDQRQSSPSISNQQRKQSSSSDNSD